MFSSVCLISVFHDQYPKLCRTYFFWFACYRFSLPLYVYKVSDWQTILNMLMQLTRRATHSPSPIWLRGKKTSGRTLYARATVKARRTAPRCRSRGTPRTWALIRPCPSLRRGKGGNGSF